MERASRLKADEGTRAVIVAGGSFSPVTYMHLLLMENTRDAAIRRGLDVQLGILSPVGDSYNKPDLLPAEDRLAMLRIATADSPWLVVGEWESQQARYCRSYEVVEWARTQVPGARPASVRVVFACGADLLHSMTSQDHWPRSSVERLLASADIAVLPRPGEDVSTALQHEVFQRSRDRIWAVDGVHSEISSSTLRTFARTGRSIRYMTPDGVIEYMAKRGLFGLGRDRAPS